MHIKTEMVTRMLSIKTDDRFAPLKDATHNSIKNRDFDFINCILPKPLGVLMAFSYQLNSGQSARSCDPSLKLYLLFGKLKFAQQN